MRLFVIVILILSVAIELDEKHKREIQTPADELVVMAESLQQATGNLDASF